MHGPDEKILALAADIVSAHVARHTMDAAALPGLIHDVVLALLDSLRFAEAPQPLQPAVPVAQSVARDSIACLECGKRFRTLKRHLEREHQMTAEAYRSRWRLPPGYKLSAPAYAQIRADVARKIGLGRRPRPRSRRSGPSA